MSSMMWQPNCRTRYFSVPHQVLNLVQSKFLESMVTHRVMASFGRVHLAKSPMVAPSIFGRSRVLHGCRLPMAFGLEAITEHVHLYSRSLGVALCRYPGCKSQCSSCGWKQISNLETDERKRTGATTGSGRTTVFAVIPYHRSLTPREIVYSGTHVAAGYFSYFFMAIRFLLTFMFVMSILWLYSQT